MKAPVVKFRGNPKPAVRHDNVPVVIVLPVIRIEKLSPQSPRSGRTRRRQRPRGGA